MVRQILLNYFGKRIIKKFEIVNTQGINVHFFCLRLPLIFIILGALGLALALPSLPLLLEPLYFLMSLTLSAPSPLFLAFFFLFSHFLFCMAKSA